MTATLLFAGRSVRRISRSPDVVVSTVIFPLLLLLTLHAVFSSAVESFEDGAAYGQRLVPTLVFSGVMFGAIGTSAGILTELENGWIDRLRSMPLNPLSPLAGTILGETVRAVAAVIVLAGIGYLFDFRFHAGVLPSIGFVLVAMAAAIAVGCVGAYLATTASSREALLGPLNAVFLLLLFLSRGMVPLEAYPGWVQPVVRYNPATAYVDLLDRLARGGALVGPTLVVVAWTVGFVVVFGVLAARRLGRQSSAT
ncbi:MAG: ABC transporter permease [Actinomycetota bacterium]